MGELSPVIEGHVKYREGKKWKQRYARIIRISPVADCLTLQLWRDGREAERGISTTKGSTNLTDYIGCEHSFNLDKEANTIALIFKQMVVMFAFEEREALIKWQVRLSQQFEEGLQFAVHLVTAPKKAKLTAGPMRIHLQNMKFSMSSGIPPVLCHSWDLVDLRRYGAVEGGRFCFEGGTRCGRGEGLHVFRVDNPEDLQISFDLASKGKLENKKRAASSGFAMSVSPSISSNLCAKSDISGSSISTLLRSSEELELEKARSRSRSRSVNPSLAWSSVDGSGLALSSPETLSLTLSELEAAGLDGLGSPDHLVSRRAVLDRIGLADSNGHNRSSASSRSCGSEDDFYLNWSVEKNRQPGVHHPPFRRQGSYLANSIDRMSVSSGDSCATAHSTYDHPKTVLKVTSSPLALKRNGSSVSAMSGPPVSPLRRAMSERANSVISNSSGTSEMRRMVAATPCGCGDSGSVTGPVPGPVAGYENYDIPRNLGRQEAMQFYDTPRNVREAMESYGPGDGMGNYDVPQAGVLPVFRKNCGCILRLTSGEGGESGQVLTWTCVKEESELKIPRVKLTGQGKMPVVDMSKINANAMRCLSEPPQQERARPVSPPQALYAQVDKSRKSQAGRQPAHPNYTNLEFANSLALYENSRDILSRIAPPSPSSPSPPPPPPPHHNHQADQSSPDHSTSNYLNMSPRRRENYEMMQCGMSRDREKPLMGFSPVKFDNLYPLCESIESMAIMCDSKFNTIKQMPKNINKGGGSNNGETGSDTDHLTLNNTNNLLTSGYVTIPRTRISDNILANLSRSSSIGSNVTMRRSASVPCKRDRDSTSSGGSDSGVSTGSPRQSSTDQMDQILNSDGPKID